MKPNTLLTTAAIVLSIDGIIGLVLPLNVFGLQLSGHISDIISVFCLCISASLFLFIHYRIVNKLDVRLLNMTLKYNILLGDTNKHPIIKKEEEYEIIKIQCEYNFDSNNLPSIEIQDKLIVDKMAEQIGKHGIITCVKANGIPQGTTSVTAFMNVLRMKHG